MNKSLPFQSVGLLSIDLGAIASNWRKLRSLAGGAECSAVVKADAYGLGVTPLAKALLKEGCESYFVASVEEGQQLRVELGASVCIYVLNGAIPGTIDSIIRWQLTPVINSLTQLAMWQSKAGARPYAAMVDTGMTRLGLSEGEALHAFGDVSSDVNLSLLLSHYSCADTPDHELNAVQLTKFRHLVSGLKASRPKLRASLSSTAGIFLGAESCFDQVRPGIGLYGVSPNPDLPLDLQRVVSLELPVVQLRRVQNDTRVGYGATQTAAAGSLLATVYGGYADGLFRSLSRKTQAYVNGVAAPIVGRVSMDYCVFDVTNTGIDEDADNGSLALELLGACQTVDELAKSGGTIGYEILTSLSRRYRRVYID